MRIIFTLLILFSCASPLFADTLYLKNGRNIEGLIKGEDADNIDLEVSFGTVKFSKTQIERIERSSDVEAAAIKQRWAVKKAEAQERAREIEEIKEHEPKQVSMDKTSGHVIVEALLNNKVKASLILDTGSSFIVLSSNIAKQLEIDVNDKATKDVQLVLADGRKVEAKYVILDSVRVQESEIEKIGVAILPEKESDAVSKDGLLGMSFLKNFNFKIDQKNSKLILEKL